MLTLHDFRVRYANGETRTTAHGTLRVCAHGRSMRAFCGECQLAFDTMTRIDGLVRGQTERVGRLVDLDAVLIWLRGRTGDEDLARALEARFGAASSAHDVTAFADQSAFR